MELEKRIKKYRRLRNLGAAISLTGIISVGITAYTEEFVPQNSGKEIKEYWEIDKKISELKNDKIYLEGISVKSFNERDSYLSSNEKYPPLIYKEFSKFRYEEIKKINKEILDLIENASELRKTNFKKIEYFENMKKTGERSAGIASLAFIFGGPLFLHYSNKLRKNEKRKD